jgi:hypothetical protein
MGERMLLTPAAITWLGSAFTEKTKISPFTTIQVSGFSETDKIKLIEEGIIDKEGAFTPASYAVFESLAVAKAYASFRLSGPFGNVDKTAYFNEKNIVTVDNAGEGLVVSTSVDIDSMAGIINEITGISRLVNAKLNIKLGVKAALAFAALVDITRKRALGQYAGYDSMPIGYTSDQILDFIQQADSGRWLTSYIKSLPLPEVSLGASEFEVAMNGLIEGGFVEKGEYGYRLLGEAYDLAVNFLVIENSVHIRCGQELDGKLVTGEAMFLQAGLHDVLMLDIDSETIEFNTVSTYTMVEYLQSLMINPPDFS